MSANLRCAVVGVGLSLACAPVPPRAQTSLAANSAVLATTTAHPPPVPASVAPIPAVPDAPAPRKPRPPLGFSSLPVADYETAVVSFPDHPAFPEPVIIVAHGAGDTPDALCHGWRDILGDRGRHLVPRRATHAADERRSLLSGSSDARTHRVRVTRRSPCRISRFRGSERRDLRGLFAGRHNGRTDDRLPWQRMPSSRARRRAASLIGR